MPPKAENHSTHAWHIYPIRLKEDCGVSRDEFIIKMAEKGIGCSVHFIPLHKQPIWRDTYHLNAEDFPVAEKVYASIVSIPLFTAMTEDDQNRVIQAIREILA